MAGKLRTIESASLPISRAATQTPGAVSVGTGGSLRMRLLDRSGTHRAHHTCSATTVAGTLPPPRAHSTAAHETPSTEALLYPDTADLDSSSTNGTTNLKVCF